jgi:hypothetical protein
MKHEIAGRRQSLPDAKFRPNSANSMLANKPTMHRNWEKLSQGRNSLNCHRSFQHWALKWYF